MIDRLKIICNKNSRSNLVEEIIEIAIEHALEEVSESMHTHLDYRCNWLGDSDKFYMSDGKEMRLACGCNKGYFVPLDNCNYKTIYDFIHNILKDKLYDREDTDKNEAAVYLDKCVICGADIVIYMNVAMIK